MKNESYEVRQDTLENLAGQTISSCRFHGLVHKRAKRVFDISLKRNESQTYLDSSTFLNFQSDDELKAKKEQCNCKHSEERGGGERVECNMKG
jgi:hypothetical protein